jgi:hypothetical protein
MTCETTGQQMIVCLLKQAPAHGWHEFFRSIPLAVAAERGGATGARVRRKVARKI